jgi:hypothetical protein
MAIFPSITLFRKYADQIRNRYCQFMIQSVTEYASVVNYCENWGALGIHEDIFNVLLQDFYYWINDISAPFPSNISLHKMYQWLQINVYNYSLRLYSPLKCF